MRLSLIVLLIACVFAAISMNSMVRAEDETEVATPELEDEDVDPSTPMAVRQAAPRPGVKYPYAYLLVEDSCKLRKKFPGVREFAGLHTPHYPTLTTKLVGGSPRLHFFTNKEDYDNYIIDYTLDNARLLEMIENLDKDPNYYNPKHENQEVIFSWETMPEDIVEVLAKFGYERSETYHKDRIPNINEGLGDDAYAAELESKRLASFGGAEDEGAAEEAAAPAAEEGADKSEL